MFRPVDKGDRLRGERMGEKVIWQMLRPYALAAGVPGIAPNDLRSYAESQTMPNQNATALPRPCRMAADRLFAPRIAA